jgi:excisionase family DNA binding protein
MSMAVSPRQLLTCREVAARLRLSERQVRRLIATGELPAYQLGGRGTAIRVPADQLERWLEREPTEPA